VWRLLQLLVSMVLQLLPVAWRMFFPGTFGAMMVRDLLTVVTLLGFSMCVCK
jgi:hypothetical protein